MQVRQIFHLRGIQKGKQITNRLIATGIQLFKNRLLLAGDFA